MNGASDWRKEIRTIPNLLSIIRILLLPFYLYFMSKQAFYLAGSIILFSGVTDFLDGYIARRFNQITELGKVLDPRINQQIIANGNLHRIHPLVD